MSKLLVAIVILVSPTAGANAQMFNPQPDPPAHHGLAGGR